MDDYLNMFNIIPGRNVGIYELGWNLSTLKNYATFKLIIQTDTIIDGDKIRFILRNKCIRHIIVFDNMYKVNGKFGIGDELLNVKKHYNCILDDTESYFRFIIPECPGIYFSLENYSKDDNGIIDSIVIFDPILGPL